MGTLLTKPMRLFEFFISEYVSNTQEKQPMLKDEQLRLMGIFFFYLFLLFLGKWVIDFFFRENVRGERQNPTKNFGLFTCHGWNFMFPRGLGGNFGGYESHVVSPKYILSNEPSHREEGSLTSQSNVRPRYSSDHLHPSSPFITSPPFTRTSLN